MAQAAAMLCFVLIHWLAIAFLVWIAAAFGLRLLRPLSRKTTPADLALGGALGLGALSTALFGLGMADLLYPLAAAGVVVSMAAVAGPVLVELLRESRALLANRFPPRSPWLAAGAALVAVPTLLLPLYPPTAFDSTMYHLPYARLFLTHHGLVPAPLLRYPVFPQLQDLLFSLALMIDGDALAALFSTVSFLLLALLLYGWTRERFTRRAGGFATALWLGNPVAFWVSTNALVDVGLVFFATASVYALSRCRQTHHDGWLVVAGACAGFAAATKYHGLFFVAVLIGAALYLAWRGRRLRPLFLTILVCGAVALPWYARIFHHTGNPFFPLFEAAFGDSAWSFRFIRSAPRPEPLPADSSWLSRILYVPTILALKVAQRCWGRSQALLSLSWSPSARWEQPWPIRFWPPLLLALPAAALLAWKTARAAPLLLLAIAYFFFWFGSAPDTRYLLPAAPLLCLVFGAALDRGLVWLGPRLRWDRAITVGLMALALLPSLGLAAVLCQRRGALPTTPANRERFLAAHLKPYRALAYLNRRCGSSYRVYALHAENMVYFARGELVGDWIGPYRFGRIIPKLGDTRALDRELRALGANFLLVRSDVGPYGSWRPTGPAADLLRLVYADRWTRVFELAPIPKECQPSG